MSGHSADSSYHNAIDSKCLVDGQADVTCFADDEPVDLEAGCASGTTVNAHSLQDSDSTQNLNSNDSGNSSVTHETKEADSEEEDADEEEEEDASSESDSTSSDDDSSDADDDHQVWSAVMPTSSDDHSGNGAVPDVPNGDTAVLSTAAGRSAYCPSSVAPSSETDRNASSGGAVCPWGVSNVVITDSSFEQNIAYFGRGGALYTYGMPRCTHTVCFDVHIRYALMYTYGMPRCTAACLISCKHQLLVNCGCHSACKHFWYGNALLAPCFCIDLS